MESCLTVSLFNVISGATKRREGGGGGRRVEVSPAPYLKIKKSVLILEKKALIESILRLNLPFKLWFYEYLGEKAPKLFEKMFIEVP